MSERSATEASGPKEQHELEEIARIAEGIAREAGALLLEGQRAGVSVREKARADLVTEYDLKSEALIREALARLLPEHSVVGEEGEADEAGELTWYVDPIDGTSNFAHGHPFFCVSMGLWRRNEEGASPLVGVVYAPAMGRLYRGTRGGGVFRNGERCSISTTETIETSLLCTGFPSDPDQGVDNNYRSFVSLDARAHGVRRCGAAALEMSLVAEGAYDGFWDIGLKAWDVAAGGLFVIENGGTLTSFDGSPWRPEDDRVVATNGPLHPALLEALRSTREAAPIAP